MEARNRMSIGQIILLIAGVLIAFGVLQRVLDKLRLTDRQALVIAAGMFAGGYLPEIQAGNLRIDIGGALIPLAVCVYLFIRAGSRAERAHALSGTLVTAAAVLALGIWFPDEPETMPIDINYVYGLAAGVIACLSARSRRNAFICGAAGVLCADIVQGAAVNLRGADQLIHLGGAGALDVVVIAGVTAVLFRELLGEFQERCMRGAKASRAKEAGGRQ